MNSKINVVATYDNNLKFFPSGELFSIDSISQVAGYRQELIHPYIKGDSTLRQYDNFLCIKTKPWGNLYLKMTLAQYNALIAAATAAPGAPEISLTYTIDTDVTPVSDTITTPGLYNLVISAIAVDGAWQDIRTIPYTSGVGAGTLNFTGIITLTPGMLVQVLGYTA